MSSKRPNILLITADQMKHDALGAAGHPVVQTPHLDALANRGTRFTNAYTTCPICVPARLSILTGQYGRGHGVLGNREMIPANQPTVASLLKDAGYRTGAFGKMHFWPPYNSFGFERMLLSEQDGIGWKVDDYHSEYLAERGMLDQWDYWDQHKPYRAQAPQEYWDTFGAKGSDIPEEHYHSTWIADKTISYLEEDDDRPFFIWTSFIKPHHPFDPPKPWDEMYDPADIPPPGRQELALEKPLMTNGGRRDPRKAYFDQTKLTEDKYKRVAAHYYGAISNVDHNVGRILQALADQGQLENTLVIFTSDHGDYMGDFGLILKNPNVPYDGLAKVPFIVAGPGCKPGRVEDHLVSLVDILPTAAKTAGVSVPGFVQGESLQPILTGGKTDDWREVLLVETKAVKAVRTKYFKYLYHHKLDIDELYDMQADPGETINLSPDSTFHGIRREMRDELLGCLLDTEWNRYEHQWSYRDLMPKTSFTR